MLLHQSIVLCVTCKFEKEYEYYQAIKNRTWWSDKKSVELNGYLLDKKYGIAQITLHYWQNCYKSRYSQRSLIPSNIKVV